MVMLVILAGVCQLALALASLAIPRVLRWSDETAKLRPLTRQVFWTYAAYIWATNVSFGLISTLAPRSLLDRSTLARAVCGFIALYWAARLLIQLFWFDRKDAPSGAIFKAAEIALTASFAFLAVVYACAAIGAG